MENPQLLICQKQQQQRKGSSVKGEDKIETDCSLYHNRAMPINTEPKSQQASCYSTPPREEGGNKSHCCYAPSMFSFSSILPEVSGLISTRPHHTLQPCLQILSGDREKNPILHRGAVHFFFYLVSYII